MPFSRRTPQQATNLAPTLRRFLPPLRPQAPDGAFEIELALFGPRDHAVKIMGGCSREMIRIFGGYDRDCDRGGLASQGLAGLTPERFGHIELATKTIRGLNNVRPPVGEVGLIQRAQLLELAGHSLHVGIVGIVAPA